MKNFHIITNEIKDKDLMITRKLQEIIEDKGGSSQVVLVDLKNNARCLKEENFLQEADCALVLGGDGTLLRVARETARKEIPLLGINLGTLGFLAEVEINRMEQAITKLLAGDYITEERMMLEGRVFHEGITKGFSTALNDITITRSGSLQIICFSIFVNHKFLCKMNADGIILSTPTGSTGYNMSAGGPIASPDAQMLILTPICAHTLNARSIILRSEDVVEIVIDHGSDGSSLFVEASFDANDKTMMQTGDSIQIAKSAQTTTIVKLDERSFIEALQRKMN